ncbi:Ig-like domain-containing protein [Nocardia sp. NPDC003979]
MSNFQARHAGVGLAVAAVAAGGILGAPRASALVQDIAVTGSTHYVGTAYTLTADVTATSFLFRVTFSDNGVQIGEPVPVRNGKATITWTPTSAGRHTLEAVQETISSETITVDVLEVPKPTPTPTPLPPPTTAPPTPGGTGSAGLLPSGSAS